MGIISIQFLDVSDSAAYHLAWEMAQDIGAGDATPACPMNQAAAETCPRLALAVVGPGVLAVGVGAVGHEAGHAALGQL